MTGMVAHRLTYSRRYGSPFHRAPRTEDGQLVPAGLLTRGSGAFSDLPEDLAEIVSGSFGADLPLTVAGAVPVLAQGAPHRVPFSSPSAKTESETVTFGIQRAKTTQCQREV